jgi:hypothetical protein
MHQLKHTKCVRLSGFARFGVFGDEESKGYVPGAPDTEEQSRLLSDELIRGCTGSDGAEECFLDREEARPCTKPLERSRTRLKLLH